MDNCKHHYTKVLGMTNFAVALIIPHHRDQDPGTDFLSRNFFITFDSLCKLGRHKHDTENLSACR